jgi:hypothetical protein
MWSKNEAVSFKVFLFVGSISSAVRSSAKAAGVTVKRMLPLAIVVAVAAAVIIIPLSASSDILAAEGCFCCLHLMNNYAGSNRIINTLFYYRTFYPLT